MIKIFQDKEHSEVEIKGNLPLICSETIIAVRAIRDALKKANDGEVKAAMFEACIHENLARLAFDEYQNKGDETHD